jgi:hypothetical protein
MTLEEIDDKISSLTQELDALDVVYPYEHDSFVAEIAKLQEAIKLHALTISLITPIK